MKKDVLGIKIDDVSIDQAVEVVEKWLSKPGKHYIVTPNPEIVVMAQKDKEFKEILNNADLAIPDGVGLKLGSLLNRRTTDIECNSPGIDVMEELIKLSSERGFTTGFLGGRDGVAKQCAERLKKKYPGLRVVFAESGGEIDERGIELINDERLKINEKVDILFVAFGPPKQEKWIARNLEKLDIKVAMGVGGAFDVFSARVPRAPGWMRGLGLEWLFRLVIEPWRIKRQLALLEYIWLLVKK